MAGRAPRSADHGGRGLVRGAVETVIGPALAGHGMAKGGVLGIDEAAMCQIQALEQLLSEIELADGDAPMQAARRVKLPGELALLQEACAIAEAVTQSAIDAVRPGVRDRHRRPVGRLLRRHGAHRDLRRAVCRATSRVHRGVRRPGRSHRDDEGRKNRHGRRGRGPGGPAEHGLADRFISLFIGHGVGIGANEPPYLGETLPGDETVTLEEGMAFAVEPLIWVPGVSGGGGVRLEDTVVVEAGGGRALTRTRFDGRLLLGDRPARRHDTLSTREG